MSRKAADFKLEDVVVSVACPYCHNKQTSPNYPNSHGWDRKDVSRYATRREINCQLCGEKFTLPAKLINLMAGV